MFRYKKSLALLYWLIIGIFLFLFFYLLVKLFPMYGTVLSFSWRLLSPFIIACLIAYLLYPIIDKIHSCNIPRGLAISLIYLLFFGGVAYLIYRVYPAMIQQLGDFNDQLPEFIATYQNLIYQAYEYTSFLPETIHDKMDQLINRIETAVDNLLTKLVSGFTRIFDMIVLLTVIPVLVFYFLKDYGKIKSFFKKFIPERYRRQTSKIVHGIDESLGNYIRGLFIVSLFVSITSLVLFYLLGVNYALLLAVIMGLTNLIPYFGPIIGAVPAIAIAFTMSGKLVIFVVIGIFVIQLVESNLLAPYIVGKSINIHPVAIIFALLLGGQLFGIIGMIIAVPVMTILKVMTTHMLAFK
ncbi:AI-2E family transporter [Virgibacillus sp. C22-A2]|uniref:AI-2E family transporter n=1 Tax=Virgibacillus tibetensis TaxID=3042313 RepID=A0ABU6KAP8_9BACI|nr:AI-2E family transporter [Virgibacillus sp. C22-A2]